MVRHRTTPAALAICSLILTLAGFASLTLALVAHGALQARIVVGLSGHLPVLIPAAFAVIVLAGAMASLILAFKRQNA
jgi:hypothetical protein